MDSKALPVFDAAELETATVFAKLDDDFRSELSALINKHCRENASDTPDYILADYLAACLDAFDAATRARTKHYRK